MTFKIDYEGNDYFVIFKNHKKYKFQYDFGTKKWKHPFIQLNEKEEAEVEEAKEEYQTYYNKIEVWINAAIKEKEFDYDEEDFKKYIICQMKKEDITTILTFQNQKLKKFAIGEMEYWGWNFEIEFLYEHFPKIKDVIEWITKKSQYRLRLLF